MPTTITLSEAQTNLKDLIARLAPGGEILITEEQQPVARRVRKRTSPPPRPAPGLGKGSVLSMSPDFDEPLEEFRECME